jgi:hypothetical protein
VMMGSKAGWVSASAAQLQGPLYGLTSTVDPSAVEAVITAGEAETG